MKILGFAIAESYSKWKSSVSKSDSSNGLVIKGRAVGGGAAAAALEVRDLLFAALLLGSAAMEEKVKSARRSFSWFGVKFQRTATP